jgi:uncharacterized protein (TIGR04255 family)
MRDIKLPKTITPCPIKDALLEIRFSTKMHPNAVFGLIYNALRHDFPNKVVSLPILQLPDALRSADPNFRYKPHYKISNDTIVAQIGPDVLSISSFPKYIGWEVFSKKIIGIIDKVEKIRIINKINRLGIRYVNFFETDIFNAINLKICIQEDNIKYKNTVIRTEIGHVDFKSTLQIANNAYNQTTPGSVIDIDTFKENGLEDFFTQKETIITNGHAIEKELFFSLLTKDFLTSLNPEY